MSSIEDSLIVPANAEDDRLSMTLVDNALDYLLSAAEHAASNSARDWKYGLLHLTAAIELLLKARLRREHWSLLFADVDKARPSSLRSGDFRSIDFQGAINRLGNISSVDIGSSANKQLKRLRDLRNQVQHSNIEVDLEQTKSLMSHGSNFFLDFLHSHLPKEMDERYLILEDIHSHLRQFDEFVAERVGVIQTELSQAESSVDCPRCWQDTVVLGIGQPRCLFCGFSMDAEAFVDFIGEGRSGYEPCLICGERTLAFVLYHNEWGVDYCASCGVKQTTCLRCSDRTVGESPECERCGYAP